MIEPIRIEHHIQKHILEVLIHHNYARFRDMRPPNTDTNLYNYHLKVLLKQDFVTKTDHGYALGRNGVLYSDGYSEHMNIRRQPKIITMAVIQNTDGELLLYKRHRQPFADQWTLPFGRLHIEDKSIKESIRREMREKLGIDMDNLKHMGDCYVRLMDSGEIFLGTFAHIFYGVLDHVEMTDRLRWVKPHKLSEYDLAPAVEQIVARTFFMDPYFFEEYSEPIGKWYN